MGVHNAGAGAHPARRLPRLDVRLRGGGDRGQRPRPALRPRAPDEYRLPPDTPEIPYDWSRRMG